MKLVQEIEYLLTTVVDDDERNTRCIEKVRDLFQNLHTLRDDLTHDGYYSASGDVSEIIERFE